MMDLSRAAQEKIREATESVDNFAKAKSELEPLGMTVVEAKVDEFRKVAQAEDLAGLQEPVRRVVGRDRRLQGLSPHDGPEPAKSPAPSSLPFIRRNSNRACCVFSLPSRKSRSRR